MIEEFSEDVVMKFKTMTGHAPYPHQIATYEVLVRGESVILRAPTVSGKNEAVCMGFNNERLK